VGYIAGGLVLGWLGDGPRGVTRHGFVEEVKAPQDVEMKA
jgi:hypothetical protein